MSWDCDDQNEASGPERDRCRKFEVRNRQALNDKGPCRAWWAIWILFQVQWESIRKLRQESDMIRSAFLKASCGCCDKDRLLKI
jgi:hypothetical protein